MKAKWIWLCILCSVLTFSTRADRISGMGHVLVIKDDGTVWAWGYNRDGQIDGTRSDKLSPVLVQGLTDVVSVAAGIYHSMALRRDGTVWAWGGNEWGQIGDGTRKDRSTPVQVVGLENVVTIAAGWYHSLAIKSDGTVWAWGENYMGQLGDGTTTSRTTPGQVPEMNQAIKIAAAYCHSLCLRRDGTVWGWGDNNHGQLGDGTIYTNRYTPVQAVGISKVIDISSKSWFYSMALTSDGRVWTWGDQGEESAEHSIPSVVSGISSVVKISNSYQLFVALTSYGVPFYWGTMALSGYDPIIESATPISVGELNEIVDINTGGALHCLKRDGTIWGFGLNMYGEVGDGTTTRRDLPVQVQGLSLAASSVADYALAADFDGDGRADPVAVDNAGQWCVWYSHQSYTRDGPYNLGMSGQPVAGDVDGDGQGDMSMVQNGQWYIWLSSHGYSQSGPYAFGVSGSPVLADFDGDGKADPAMVDSSGTWQVFLSGSGYTLAEAQFLQPTAYSLQPIAGDFDGDTKADPVMVDSSGNWYFWLSGSYYIQSGPYNFGVAGKPIAGDFDGDGKADPAMMDSSGNWYIWPSGSFYIPDGPYYLVLP